MKNSILIFAALVLSFFLGFFGRDYLKPAEKKSAEVSGKDSIKETPQTEVAVKHKKVTGIGGVFFKCKDPEKVKAWYAKHLGFNVDEYGMRFEWQAGCDPKRTETLQWSPFPEEGTYFNPSTKEFMINYTVENIEELVAQLKKDSVNVLNEIETYDYGKFVHIMDIEGNKIELYEPNYDYDPAKAE